jgi:hypothetical protein
MSIVFDESELQSGLQFSASGIVEPEQLPGRTQNESPLTETEKGLLELYRQLPEEQRSHILTHIHKLLKPAGKTKKINVLKAIEDAKQSATNENLSDIINDIVK